MNEIRETQNLIKSLGGTLVEKAWTINPYNFQEPHFVPEATFCGPTPGKAKLAILNYIQYDEHKTNSGDEINFLNLKIKRAPSADRYAFRESIKTLSQIKYDLEIQKRKDYLEKLIADNPGAKAYIAKGGRYYMSGYCGYTEQRINAGVYSIQDAAKAVRGCSLDDGMAVVVINDAEHNKMITEKIEDLKSRLI